MKCEVEEIDACNKQLKIEIPLGDYNAKIKAYYKKLSREVKVPGFRPGKVPASIMEKRFGPEVKQEVLTQLISENIAQGIQEHQLQAVSEPSIIEVEAEEGTDISVTANIEVVPEITVNDYSDIEVDLKVAKVTEEDVDKVIEEYRKGQAKSIPVTDRGVQKEDYIKIDFESTIDGKAFDRNSAKDYVIQVGNEHLVAGFDDQVMGMTIEDERTFSLDMPEDHPNKEIAGKTVDFKVTLRGIQVKELPEVNDEFAKTADINKEYATVADLRAGIRDSLEDFERQQAKKAARKILAEKIGAANPVDVPEKLVKEQIVFMVKQEKQKAAQAAGLTLPADETPEISGEDEKKHRESAVKLLQQELIIGKLADEWEINITEEDLDRELNSFASLLGGGDMKKLKQDWAQSGALLRLHSRMRRERTLDQLFEKVKVREETVDRDQITTDN
jgi:trigger factor